MSDEDKWQEARVRSQDAVRLKAPAEFDRERAIENKDVIGAFLREHDIR